MQYMPSPVIGIMRRFNMNRIKKVRLLLLLSLTMLVLQSCGDKENDKTIEEKDAAIKYFANLPSEYSSEEEPVICINTLNLDNYSDKTMRTGFLFDVLSIDELTDKDVKVNIDVETPYTLIHQSSEKIKGKFSDYICLNYNDMDWKKLKNLELDMSEEGQAELAEIKEDIETEYVMIDEKEFPEFYDNKFFVQFDIACELEMNEQFEKIEVIVGEKSYDIDIGYVGLNYSHEDFAVEDYGEYDLYFTSVGRIGYNILQSQEGIISLYGFEALTEKDLKIKNVYLMDTHGSKEIQDVEINIISEDITINRKWEPNKDIDITKGSKLSFDFKIKDEEFAKVQSYATNIYIIVEYEVDGKKYINSVQSLCESRYDGQTLYAMFKDGVDMSEYYNVYYN